MSDPCHPDPRNPDHRVEVREVVDAKDRSSFLQLPWTIYRDDANWVPPLMLEVKTRIDPTKNPYFEHARAKLFVASRGGIVVGRISAQVCDLVQSHQQVGTGHFGFFECEDSPSTADALLNAASDWLRSEGMTRIVGPVSFSIHDEAGLLIDGFHRPPYIFMAHHPGYYQRLIEDAGFQKEMDVYAYHLDISQPYPKRLVRILEMTGRDTSISLRYVNKHRIKEELASVLRIFNESWADHWGHVPMTDAEVGELAMLLKRLFGTEAVLLAEVDGEVAGFIVVIPNLNEIIAGMNGRLFPFGWMKLLHGIKTNKCTSVRVPLMGIAKQFQNSRTGASIALSMINRCRQTSVANGVKMCEMSWILETNTSMRSILEASGSAIDKTYRLYGNDL